MKDLAKHILHSVSHTYTEMPVYLVNSIIELWEGDIVTYLSNGNRIDVLPHQKDKILNTYNSNSYVFIKSSQSKLYIIVPCDDYAMEGTILETVSKYKIPFEMHAHLKFLLYVRHIREKFFAESFTREGHDSMSMVDMKERNDIVKETFDFKYASETVSRFLSEYDFIGKTKASIFSDKIPMVFHVSSVFIPIIINGSYLDTPTFIIDEKQDTMFCIDDKRLYKWISSSLYEEKQIFKKFIETTSEKENEDI